MKPPVEAPTSSARAPVGSSPNRSSAASSLSPPRDTNRGRSSTSTASCGATRRDGFSAGAPSTVTRPASTASRALARLVASPRRTSSASSRRRTGGVGAPAPSRRTPARLRAGAFLAAGFLAAGLLVAVSRRLLGRASLLGRAVPSWPQPRLLGRPASSWRSPVFLAGAAFLAVPAFLAVRGLLGGARRLLGGAAFLAVPVFLAAGAFVGRARRLGGRPPARHGAWRPACRLGPPCRAWARPGRRSGRAPSGGRRWPPRPRTAAPGARCRRGWRG